MTTTGIRTLNVILLILGWGLIAVYLAARLAWLPASYASIWLVVAGLVVLGVAQELRRRNRGASAAVQRPTSP